LPPPMREKKERKTAKHYDRGKKKKKRRFEVRKIKRSQKKGGERGKEFSGRKGPGVPNPAEKSLAALRIGSQEKG